MTNSRRGDGPAESKREQNPGTQPSATGPQSPQSSQHSCQVVPCDLVCLSQEAGLLSFPDGVWSEKTQCPAPLPVGFPSANCPGTCPSGPGQCLIWVYLLRQSLRLRRGPNVYRGSSPPCSRHVRSSCGCDTTSQVVTSKCGPTPWGSHVQILYFPLLCPVPMSNIRHCPQMGGSEGT